MENASMDVMPRGDTGKGAARKLRQAGKLPGVLYGEGDAPRAILLDAVQFDLLRRSGAHQRLLDVHFTDGKQSIKALVRFQDQLLILKDRSCYSLSPNDDPFNFQGTLTTLSGVIGCDAPLSAKETPFGVMWAKSLDDVFLWRGGEVLRIQGSRGAHVRSEGRRRERRERRRQAEALRPAVGRRQDFKKAHVRLAPGQRIETLAGTEA